MSQPLCLELHTYCKLSRGLAKEDATTVVSTTNLLRGVLVKEDRLRKLSDNRDSDITLLSSDRELDSQVSSDPNICVRERDVMFPPSCRERRFSDVKHLTISE